MPTAEERMKILEMVQVGEITPEQGAKLLEALHADKSSTRIGCAPKWLRISITDPQRGYAKVNISIPMSLVMWGLEWAQTAQYHS